MPNDTLTLMQRVSNYCSSQSDLQTFCWKAMNFATVVGLTSAVTSVVHSPLNAYMFAKMRDASFTDTKLWRGSGAYYVATIARMSYLSGVKKNERLKGNQVKDDHDSQPSHSLRSRRVSQYEKVAYFTLGEVFTVQVLEVLSQMRRLSAEIREPFRWHTKHNFYQLATTTVGARYCFGYVNFLALCQAEPFFANRISISDPTVKYLCSGAASGMTAAFFSFPFAYYRDYSLAKATTIVDGKMQTLKFLNVMEQMFKDIKHMGLLRLGVDQLLPRLIRTSTRFAILVSIGSACGEEPLRSVGIEKHQLNRFFSNHKPMTKDVPQNGADKAQPGISRSN